jgi:autotransporter-associated beta strand protein
MKKLIGLFVVVGLCVGQGMAQFVYWQGTNSTYSGDFETPSNWQGSVVPGIADWACFKNSNSKNWQIALSSDVVNDTMLADMDSLNNETLFVLNQHVWTATNRFIFRKGVGGLVTVTNGMLRTRFLQCSPEAASSNYMTLAMKDVVCEATNATFAASTVSFDGGALNCLSVTNALTMGASGYGKGTLILRNGAQCNVTNSLFIGDAAGATGELANVSGQIKQVGGPGTFVIGNYGCGTLTLNGGSTYIAQSPRIGSVSGSTGMLNVLGGSNTFATATGVGNRIFLVRGSLLSGGGTNWTAGIEIGSYVIGYPCEMILTNGLWNIGEHMYVGQSGNGSLTVRGGTMHFQQTGAVLAVGRSVGGTGVVSVAGGLLDMDNIWMGGGANALARLTLSGNGVLRTKNLFEKDAAAISQVVFDGGTLQPSASGTLVQTLDDVRLTANGLVVDSAGYNVSVVPELKDATGEAGSVTKKGAGVLTLAGTRTATGPVSVLGGTLVVSNGVAVTTGISRIDGVLSLTSDNRLTVGAGATLSGTGMVTRVTLADGAVFAKAKADGAATPLTIADCVAGGEVAVQLSGYDLAELKKSLPLISVPDAFVDPSKVTVTLNGQTNTRLRTKCVNVSGRQVLCVFYFEGTLISVF